MRQFFAIFLLFCSLAASLTCADASRRPGIMRPVPLASGAPAVRGAWRVDTKSKEITLVFTREANGTRNLWQATAREEGEWPQKPLTNLSAPLWADEVQVSRDGNTIVCVTNAVGGNQTPQIARLNSKTGSLEAITRDSVPLHSPTLSPDGKSLAFVRKMDNTSTIFLLSLHDNVAPSIPRRVIEGHRPAWLDNGTLLFSDVRKNGLYRLDIPADWPPLLPLKSKPRAIAFRGGEVTVVPDASQLCIAVDDDRNNNPARLFFMAPNGSGERALRNTDGARAPRFAPDGTALLFDAPLFPNGPRTLWVMNLTPIVPTVEIARVTADKAGLYIIGTVFCEDSPEVDVKLEAGQGDAPQQWQTIATPKAPLQKEALARWQPPENAHGDWTLRLTATSPDGDLAQAIMTVALPLSVGKVVTNASPDVSIFVAPVSGAAGLIGTHGIDSAVIPGEWVKGVFVPRGSKTFPEENLNTVPNAGLSNLEIIKVTPSNPSVLQTPPPAPPVALPPPPKATKDDSFIGALPKLPLPALPPPPSDKGLPPTDSGAPYVTLPIAPPAVSVPAKKPALGGPKETLPQTKITLKPPDKPAPKPIAKAPVKTTRTNGTSQIIMDVPNFKNGEDANITGTVRNTGKTVWSSSGDNPVRLLVRWFDESTGRRFRWELKWLPNDLAPGESVPMTFTITPPRTGRLRLNFAVVRLPGSKYLPASATDNVDNLDKIGEKTFRVTVE